MNALQSSNCCCPGISISISDDRISGMEERPKAPLSKVLFGCLLVGGALILAGCATPAQTAALAAGGAIVSAASMPGHDLEQTYYLGSFDPEEQLPPAMYRITVRGQASSFSRIRFASGWVPAFMIDSLRGQVGIDPNSEDPVTVTGNESSASNAPVSKSGGGNSSPEKREPSTDPISAAPTAGKSEVKTSDSHFKIGRRLIMFGPEGFREAPRGHRLVIVMGASPEKFFEQIDTALGDVSGMSVERANSAVQGDLFKEYARIQGLRQGLNQVKLDIESDLK